jgi:hypothetical protein
MARVFGTVLVGLLWTVSAAMAVEDDPQCVEDAREAKKLCDAACREQYQVSKDECRNVDHDCAEACRAGRRACFDQPLADLQACVEGCNSTHETKRADCRAQFEAGTPERDQCIDQAQVEAFQCRDQCRENVGRAALKQCRKTFRACIGACPPAD